MSSLNRAVDIGSHQWPDTSRLQDPDALLQQHLSVIPEGPAYQSAIADIWAVTPEISPPCTPVLGPTQGRGDYPLLVDDGFNLDSSPSPYTAQNDTSQVLMVNLLPQNPLPQNQLPQNSLLSASPPTATPEIQLPSREVSEPTPQSSRPPRNYTPVEVRSLYTGDFPQEWYMGDGRWHPMHFTSRAIPYFGSIPHPTTPGFGSPEPEQEGNNAGLYPALPKWRQPSPSSQAQVNQQLRERLGQNTNSPESYRAREPCGTGLAVRPPLVRFNNYQPSAPGGRARTPQHSQICDGLQFPQ